MGGRCELLSGFDEWQRLRDGRRVRAEINGDVYDNGGDDSGGFRSRFTVLGKLGLGSTMRERGR